MKRSKPIIGLSGGIGSGKSAVAKAMESAGALVIDSDRHAQELLDDAQVCGQLAQWWGEGVLDPSGRIDRRRVAEIVFGRVSERERLEGLLHPLIARRREDMITRGLTDGCVRAIILDSPLLFERNLDQLCDVTVFVESDEMHRRERVRLQRGWDADELKRREQTQWPPERKRGLADYVIHNDGSLHELRQRSAALFEEVLKSFQCV